MEDTRYCPECGAEMKSEVARADYYKFEATPGRPEHFEIVFVWTRTPSSVNRGSTSTVHTYAVLNGVPMELDEFFRFDGQRVVTKLAEQGPSAGVTHTCLECGHKERVDV